MALSVTLSPDSLNSNTGLSFITICLSRSTESKDSYTTQLAINSIQERIKGTYSSYPKVIPQVIFRSPPLSEIPGASRNSQFCDMEFAPANSPICLTRIFILHENIRTMHVITSAEELGTMSKNNLRGITLGIRPI